MKKIIFHLLLISCITFTSCTKVVNIDLNSASPNIVVDAEVTDQPGSYTVNLTQTVNFSDNNVFPAVTGAIVIINDNAGNSETLTEIGSGNYVTSHLQGVNGRAYHISITSNNKNYMATSIMPAPVALDSVIADTSSRRTGGGGFGGGGNTTTVTGISVRAVFADPAGVVNYYRLIEYVNRVPNYNNITIISDQGIDGTLIARNVARRDTSIHKGDTISVSLESIDANVYEYYRTLRLTTRGQTGIQTATPGNPTTNLSNNALGVFSAYALRSKYVIAP
ncbi:MAG TPA: DUF4249 domain-containing protein [Bacteroidia bacterium]|nr:DUF4249 domain-containing protein [Bacteroidia bacterium]